MKNNRKEDITIRDYFENYLKCQNDLVFVYGFVFVQEHGEFVITQNACLVLPEGVSLPQITDQMIKIPFVVDDRVIDDERIYNYIEQCENKRLDFLYNEKRDLYVIDEK